ncbi:MAG: DNA polymerase III subunit gamma/tau [Paludibacteraceae bacterium]
MEENYIVSARKYRPMTFETVVGQKFLTETLQNAIRQNHLAHAYLFCGPRGVGKTTCARIFAKTINCLQPTKEYDACNECESCRAFNEQRSFNIHELDAASNNSVDDIRSLIDQVRVPPQIGKYSVYIIDEVHMLSSGAFNALLKTLEEPPAHAIFILATTEKHKVLPTILSRCQVYDFARITVADTIAYLQQVAAKEGITVTEDSLNVVAQKADGGMRDALSIFDQLVSFCGTTITYERTLEILNVLSTEYYFRMTDLALQHDVTGALLLLNDVLNRGFDAGHFVTGLAAHLRNVLVAKDPQTVQLLETSDSIRQQYVAQAQPCSPRWLFAALDILNTCDINYRIARNKRLSVELALVKLTQFGVAQPAAQAAPTVAAKPAAAPAAKTAQQPAKAAPASVPAPAAAAKPAPTRVAPMPTMPNLPSVNVAVAQKETTTVKTAEPVLNPAKEERTTPFSQDRLIDAWVGLKTVLKDEPRLLNLCSFYHPVLGEDFRAHIEVANPWDFEDLKRYLPTLHKLMRDALHNDRLQFTVSQAKYDAKKVAFTAEEKYKLMSEEKAELNNLRALFDLQID